MHCIHKQDLNEKKVLDVLNSLNESLFVPATKITVLTVADKAR